MLSDRIYFTGAISKMFSSQTRVDFWSCENHCKNFNLPAINNQGTSAVCVAYLLGLSKWQIQIQVNLAYTLVQIKPLAPELFF